MLNSVKEDRRSGIVTVELALVLPLLLLLTFGLMEYGWLFLKANQITNAARQGARVAATPDATDVEVEGVITGVLENAGIGASAATVSFSPASVTSPLPGETLTVTVSVAYAEIRLLGIPFIPVPDTLQAETSMAKEGP